MQTLTVKNIAELIGGKVVGNENLLISKLQRIEDASQGGISFLARPEYEKFLIDSNVSCVLVSQNCSKHPNENQAFVVCDDPYLAFIKLIKHFESQRIKPKSEIHPSAVIADNVHIGENVQIGANSVILNDCIIGDNTIINPNVVLYRNVQIGSDCIINSSVVCYHETIIGNNCIIHSGAVIGADGFGYLENKETGKYDKIPQVGNVVIGDDVEIGANATIDRALLGSTVIESGVKIDNLVHVAHNCLVGENTGIAAQTGISGSSKIGKRNRFGGQVGLAGHLETANDVTLIAQSGVSKSVTKPGIYFGTPIKERLHAFKIEACIRQLPEMFAEIDKIKKHIKEK